LPWVSEKSPGACPEVVPEELPGDAALVPAPTEVPPAVVPPAAPAPALPPAPPPAANAQLEDIASAAAIAIVVIFMTFVSLCMSNNKDRSDLTFRLNPTYQMENSADLKSIKRLSSAIFYWQVAT
jgi:hypothetical protein